MKEFEGKVAVVTGGSGGIGRAAAFAFARKGAKVALADVFIEGGEETALLIKGQGGGAFFMKTDVSNSTEVKALIDKTIETYGRIDYAHNNAGIDGAQANTSEYPEEMWNRVIGINLTGVWICMKYEISQMLKQGKGSIVNTASVGGLMALSKISAYIAAKFGVIGITKTAALEYATQGIRVNAICPGWTDTPMTVREAREAGIRLEEYKEIAANFVPVKRMGTPEEMAEAVVWLCSDAASYVTGHALVVDGAITAGGFWGRLIRHIVEPVNQACSIFNAYLFKNRFYMVLNGIFADEEPVCNFNILKPLKNEMDYFDLPLAYPEFA